MISGQPAKQLLNPPVRRSKWRRWRIWLLVLAVVAGLVGYQQWEAWQGEAELRDVLSQWDGHGTWRWKEWIAQRPVVPDPENGAIVIDQMAQLKPRNLETDLSLALFSDDFERYPQHFYHEEQIKELRSRVAKCQPVLALFPQFASKKTTIWAIPDNVTPFAAPFSGIDRSREIINVLIDQFEMHLHDGKLNEAVNELKRCLMLTRCMEHQLTLLGRLVQISFLQNTCTRIQRLLALSEPDDGLLAQLQSELLPFDEQSSWKKTVFIESGTMDQCVRDMHNGKLDVNMLFGGSTSSTSWWKEQLDAVSNYFQSRALLSPRQHATCMRMMLSYYQHADESWRQQLKHWKSVDDQLKTERTQGKRTLCMILAPAMYKVGQSEVQMIAKLRATRLTLAAERFRRKENRWPTSQNELVDRYLDKIQIDPFDDQPLRLKRTPDGLIIYSIGKDEKDNGGFVLANEEEGQPQDVGIRLWDIAQRRQPARPLPEEYLNKLKYLKAMEEIEKKSKEE